MKKIFLSASIPLPDRDAKYYETADIVAIREAVIALTTSLTPECQLVWGGHPSITPLIYYVMQKRNMDIGGSVKLYQSRFFEKFFPEDNNKFNNVVVTDIVFDREQSLAHMRERMFSENEFNAAVFIGGMEGIETEYKMFIERFPEALLMPLASTGAATRIVYDNWISDEIKSERLVKDYGYMSLFQKYLIEKL